MCKMGFNTIQIDRQTDNADEPSEYSEFRL